MTALSAPGHLPGPGTYPSFRLPAFPRFQPALRRPALDELESFCRTWLEDTLRPAHAEDPCAWEEFLQQRTTLWNLLTYPTCDPERTKTICHWIDILFRIDDLFVHAPRPRLDQLGLHRLDTALDPEQPTSQAPYPQVLAGLAQRLRAGMPPGLWDRFSQETKGFFAACRTEREWLDEGTAVNLAMYEASRINSVAGGCFPLLEYGLGIDLTRELDTVPDLGRLTYLVARHWIAVNDIFSYRKEHYSGDTVNEITLALAADGGDLQDAIDRITQTVTDIEDEFCTLAEQLLGDTDGQPPAVIQYIQALHWAIAGNLEWSYITPRYNGRGHTWDGRTTATVVLTPHRTLYLPEQPCPPATPTHLDADSRTSPEEQTPTRPTS
ncbi:hypothetical protein [Streptomyces sp. NPDC007117]|uniref:terpene synthase family protein n=1 Tax=Streptomyces sp. NPDC007117 TaxID=3154314 RepID=UPI0033C5EF06